MASACKQSTTEISNNPVFTSAIVPKSGGERSANAALVLGVKLTADKSDEGHEVHPDQQGDDRADGAVHHVVVGDVAGVPGERGGGEQPKDGRQDRARPHVVPALVPVGAEVI